MKVSNGSVSEPKLFPCLFKPDVLCTSRKSDVPHIMGRCFKCERYKTFMVEMQEADEEEDTKFLAEQERVNRFARCMFEDCLCDGEMGKLACFVSGVAGGKVWTCRRFDVGKLNPDSAMVQVYRDFVKGRSV